MSLSIDHSSIHHKGDLYESGRINRECNVPVSGKPITAKDFRTLFASSVALNEFQSLERPSTTAIVRRAVAVGKAASGHFEADGVVNGAGVSFLVDTGASSVVLTMDAAKAAGIAPDGLAFTFPVSTANGMAFAAKVTLDEVRIGDIARKNISAMVAEPGKLDQSLLGMSFLSSLSAYAVQQDQMILQD